MFREHSLDFVFKSQIDENQARVIIKNILKPNIESRYVNYWLKIITNENCKLRTYSKFKNSYNLEPYLTQMDSKNRKILTRFRISNHNLAIEKGRYTIPKTPLNKKKCKNCNNKSIEDEEHFLLICPKYDLIRNTFLNKIKIPTKYETTSLKFTFLFSNIDPLITTELTYFICTLQEKRNLLLLI
jgi:hypothetical protein